MDYPRKWKLPNEAKIVLSVGLAFESFEKQSQYSHFPGGKIDHFSLSYGDYGWKSGAWRLFDTLAEFGIRGSMSTNGQAAERHPKVVEAAAKAGYEVNGHGWANDVMMSDDDPERERQEIRRCTQILEQASGTRPVGWTSPGNTGTANTLDFLAAEGYIWNGDDASEDLPFLRKTKHGNIVILPRANLPHNDLIMWVFTKVPPVNMWLAFKETFDQLYAEGAAGSPKGIEMTLHCHVAGRPTFIPVIKQCLAYAKQHDDVWFARKRDIAEWALKAESGATG